MKKYLKFVWVLSIFYLIGCGDSSNSTASSSKIKEPVATTDNSVAVIMPVLPGVSTLPSETLEVK